MGRRRWRGYWLGQGTRCALRTGLQTAWRHNRPWTDRKLRPAVGPAMHRAIHCNHRQDLPSKMTYLLRRFGQTLVDRARCISDPWIARGQAGPTFYRRVESRVAAIAAALFQKFELEYSDSKP